MANASSSGTALDRIVFGWTTPDYVVASLQRSYPDLEVIMALGESFIDALPDADAAVAWSLTPEEFAAATKLGWLQSIGAGVERTLLPGMRERGLIVTNTSGIHATNISEHVLGMMLAFARRFPFLIRAQIDRVWRDDEGRAGVFELEGQTLVIAGYGDIGQALAARAKAFGMRVEAIRRNPTGSASGAADRVSGFEALDGLLGEADHLAICLPQTPATIGLFDAHRLSKIKRGAYLYNIGRGPIVDTDALVAALQSGALAGAGLDVTEPEPLPNDSPLWDMQNVLITMHTSGASPKFWPRIEAILLENIGRYRRGEALINTVDYDAGY